MIEGKDILFVGLGKSAVLWYRCVLPALHLGADWVGVRGEPPGVQVMTGLVGGDTVLPHYDNYKVIVLQQVFGRAWLKQIHALKERGIKVLYEVDDYLHGVAKQPHHDFAKYYTKQLLTKYEICMRACDGIICSTEYIARRYAKFNRKIYVCRNGLDLARYKLTRPERPWALPSGVATVPIMRGDERIATSFVDQGDYDRVAQIRWGLHEGGYAVGKQGGRNVYMHRLILGAKDERVVDHKNTEKLDNRRENLELVDDDENKRRRMMQDGASTRGARPNKNGKWTAYVDTPGGRKWLGHTHPTEEDARAAVAAYRGEHVAKVEGPAPIRRMCNVGWAGATGHIDAVLPWLNELLPVMKEDPSACFVAIGQPGLATPMNQLLDGERALGIPFAPLENYPAAMCMFDIALAPAGQTSWYRGKSDLRWLEAGALGVPTIADPVVYPEITHGVDGFWAESPQEMRAVLEELLADEGLRRRVGEAAREHVHQQRSSVVAAQQWMEVCSAVVGEYESMSQLKRSTR